MGNRGPSSTSNTSNYYQTDTNLSGVNIGFTGENARDILANLFGTSENVLGHLSDRSSAVQRAGFDYSSHVIDRSSALFERASLNATSTLNGVVNATRDFAQRAIAAGTGQATPLQHLSEASQYSGTEPGGSGGTTWIILGTIVALLALWKDK